MIYNYDIQRPYAHCINIFKEILLKYSPVSGEELTLREAEPEDALKLNIREEQRDCFDNIDMDYAIRMHAYLNLLTPMNYTLLHGDKILMCITIMPKAVGVGEISFLTDQNFVEANKAVKFAVIRAFHEGLDNLPFRRVQCLVREDFEVGRTFVKKMGMEEEGVLRKFGPQNHNYVMHSLLKV